MKLFRQEPGGLRRRPHPAELCQWVEENAPLYCYGDLPDEQRQRLEAHIRECAACRDEVHAVQTVIGLLDDGPQPEPTASTLAASRIRLEEALDHERAPRKSRLGIAFDAWAFHLKAVPSLAAGLLMVGILGGGAGGWAVAHREVAKAAESANSAKMAGALPDSIANVSGITQQPGTNLVQVSYNRLVPDVVEGSPNDPRIQQLLLMASQNPQNPGVRVDSVGLLAQECRQGSVCEQDSVREALRAALRYDKNPAVRLKALEGLQPFVAQDAGVRNSVLEALLHDENPGVRTEAIQMISPAANDGSVREVLHTLADSDRNPYIRTVSQETLAQEPEMQ